jgi:transcriptional regulator with GAF, ATPase, and Fis domain/serine/threonine protein kinase/tetratricopeptide (TPR) repeat protein
MPLAGRYELGERLGEGASSEVFRARDTSHDRDVALKLSLTSLPPEEAARLRREFKVLASLQHPRIIRTYDYGLTEDGRAYLSLELLEGKSLDRSVSGWGPELARYALQALDALAFIHSEGYVHNDIKPSNLMVAPEKSGLVVMDFGFAEPQSKLAFEATGTLGYMAPEALKGSEVDGRADLYSLGSVLYELACGRRPFEDKSPIEEIRKSLAGTPPLPSSLDKNIPPVVNEFLLKLLARNPDERYPSAREASKALAEAVGMEADPLTASYSARPKPGRFVGREPELATLSEALGGVRKTKRGSFALLSGPEGIGKTRLLLEFKFTCQLQHLQVRSVNGEHEAQSLPEWLSGLTDSAHTGVVLIDDLDEWSREGQEVVHSHWIDFGDLEILWIFSSKKEESLAQWTEQERPQSKVSLEGLGPGETKSFVSSILSPFPELESLAQWVYEQTRGNPSWIQESLRFLYDAGFLTPFGSGWRVDFARLPEAWVGKGSREALLARLSRLSPGAKRLLQIVSAVGPRFGMDVLESLFGEGFDESWRELLMRGWIASTPGGSTYAFRIPAYQSMVYEGLAEEERRTLHRKIGEWFESHGAGPEVLVRHFALCGDLERGLRYSLQAGEVAEAIPLVGAGKAASHFEQAISLAFSLGQTSLEKELCLRTGKLYEQRGEYDKALALYDRAEVALDSKEGKERALVLRRKGTAFMLKGELEKAQYLLEKALEFIGDSPEKGLILNDLGYVVYRRGKYERARDLFFQAESLLKRLGEVKNLVAVQTGIAQIMQDMGQIEEAIEVLNKTLKSARDPKQRPAILCSLGRAYRRAGRPEDARIVLLKAVEEGMTYGRVADQTSILTELGIVEENLKRWTQASGHYEQALALYRKVNDRLGSAIMQSFLSWVYLKGGELHRALALGEKSLQRMMTLGDDTLISNLQHTLGLIHARLGNWDEAVRLFQNCFLTRERLGYLQDCINPLSDLGSLYFDQGLFEEALKLFDKGLSYAGESKKSLILTSRKAQALAGMGKLQEAEDLACQALAEAKELGDEESLAFCERAWGYILRKKGHFSDAQQVLLSSANRFRSLKDPYETARALLEAGEAGLEHGLWASPIDTGQLLTEASQIFERLDARHDLERERVLEHRLFPALLRAGGESPARQSLVEALSKVSELLDTLTSEEEVYACVLELLVTLFSAERGILFLKDPLEDALKVAKAYPPSLEQDQATLNDARDLSKTSALSAMSQEEVIFSNSALSDERFANRQSVILNRIQSLMCAPLKLGGEVIGAIYIDSRLGATLFSEQDRPFLKAVANVASSTIEKAREYRELKERAEALRNESLTQGGLPGMIGTTQAMLTLFTRARQVAETDATILIEGESGTGKGLVAKAVHCLSKRKDNPWVRVDCGALPETLLESELFGHRKGSFTGAIEDRHGLFEEAHGGTVFLDEISTASFGVQAKLLEVLQEGEIRRVGETKPRKVDVRVICATNKNLEAEVALKRFRRDLFYRLKVVSLKVPPLRERRGDIYLLAEHFRKYYAAKIAKTVRGFRKDAVEGMLRSPWEGNVRELQYAVERAVVLCQGSYLGLSDLEIKAPLVGPEVPFKELIETQQKFYVQHALEASEGNVLNASRRVGMTRKEFTVLMTKFGIKSPHGPGRPKNPKIP